MGEVKFSDYLIQRKDKTRILIAVELYCMAYGGIPEWRFQVAVCAPRKRSYIFIADEWSNEWRNRTKGEVLAERMKYVTPEEVQEAMECAWMKLKPATPPRTSEVRG